MKDLFGQSIAIASVPIGQSIAIASVPIAQSIAIVSVPIGQSIAIASVLIGQSIAIALVPIGQSIAIASVLIAQMHTHTFYDTFYSTRDSKPRIAAICRQEYPSVHCCNLPFRFLHFPVIKIE